ncbi:MAG: hypothetical protein ACK4Z9_02270 [Thermodesulfovibrionales bacterium]
MGLRRKGLFTFTLILAPSLIIFAFLSIRFAEKQILRSEAERVSLITEIVRNGLVTIMIEGRGRDLKRFLDALIAEDIEGIYILNREGNIISSTTSPALDKRFLNQVLSRSWKGKTQEMSLMKINEKDIYSSILPIYNERPCQKCHGSQEDIRAILHIEISRAKTISKLKNLRYQVIFLTSFVFVILLYLFYRFNINNLLRPITQMTDTLKKHGAIDSKLDMDELQILMFHMNDLSRNIELMDQETKALQSTNKELLKKIDNLKMAVKEDVARPLSKIMASIEAFSEELDHNDPKKEILKTFISEHKRLLKILEGLNKS